MKRQRKCSSGLVAELPANLRWGIKRGLSTAVFFAIVATVALAGGESQLLSATRTSYAEVIVFYFVGGLIIGALLGLLRPVAKNRLGAPLVGWLLATLGYIGVVSLLIGFPWRWPGFFWLGVVIMGAALGIPSGVIHWRRYNRNLQHNR